MAFVRAWAEGVDPAQAWVRYLGQGLPADVRRARAELQRLLDLLRGVARAQGRADLAALLRRDPEAMAEPAADRPSLDDFRAQQPEDFYSEAELLAMYEDQHGAPDARSGTRRRQRLRARQVAALQWLETVVVREPRPEDAVAGWLDERLAARLSAAGVQRLADLKRRITARGFHWHRGIPRVGPAAAGRLTQWWQQHARTLGALPVWALRPPGTLDRAALMARTAPRAGLPPAPVPLERLTVPAQLLGLDGVFRAPASALRIQAADDLQALQAWLRLREPGSATWRAYRKEAERLLLWALWVAGKPLSSLDADDLRAYQAFLQQPAPGWTAPRGTPRWHDDWRPFEGPLSPRSTAMAVGILRGLFGWWVAQGYLAVNSWTLEQPGRLRELAALAESPSPFPGVAHAQPVDILQRALSDEQAQQVQGWIERCVTRRGHTAALLRLQALWSVARASGLRPAELVAARLDWVHTAQPGDVAAGSDACDFVKAVWLVVPADAPTGAPRRLPLDGPGAEALRRYLESRQLSLAGPGDGPLFAQLRTPAALSPARLYEVLADAFARCAKDLAPRQAGDAQAIAQASTLWLRHGFGLQAAARCASAQVLQQQLGHRSRASTAAYRRAVRIQRQAI